MEKYFSINHIYIIRLFCLLFFLGIITIPTIAAGLFIGGYIIRKFKLSLLGIAKFSLLANVLGFLFNLLNFALICENKSVAGLTLTYDGCVFINLSIAQYIKTQCKRLRKTVKIAILTKLSFN